MSTKQPQSARPPAATTIDGAAEYLHVNHKTLRKMIAEGTLPATRIGRLYRVRYADLDAFLTPAPPSRRR